MSRLHGLSRRGFGVLAIAAFIAVAPAASVAQDAFPSKPIRILVPFPPGGSGDIITRIVANAMQNEFKQQVLVINMPGAGSAAAAAEALKSPRDGYTIIQASSNFVLNPFFAKNIGFDIVKDFTPVTQLIEGAQVLAVSANVPTGSWGEFVKYWKDNQKTFNVATYGYGSESQILAHHVGNLIGVDPFYIHYPGGGPAYAAIIRGDTHAIFSTLAPALPQLKAAKVKAVAVTSSQRATKWLPDVPTLKELGVDFSQNIVFGLAVASGTPDTIVQKLAEGIARAVNNADTREKVEANGMLVKTSTPAEYAAFLENERKLLAAALARKPLPETK